MEAVVQSGTPKLSLRHCLRWPRLNFARIFRLPKLSLSKFLQMRLNVFLFRCLPFSVSRWCLATLGRLFYLFNWQERKLIHVTVRRVFQKRIPPRLLKMKIKETFQGIFDHYHEKFFVAYSNFPRLLDFLRTRVRFQGQQALDEALAQGKGIILVTGHYGAVEFLPGALAVNNYPASMIYRDFQINQKLPL